MNRVLTRLVLPLLIGAAAVLVGASPAQAHDAAVSGSSDCDTVNGQWVITWTLRNDQQTKDATLLTVVPSPDSPVEGIEVGAVVPKRLPTSNNGELRGVQRVPGTTTEATLTVGLDWPSHDEDGRTYTGRVALAGKCQPEEPTKPAPTAVGKSDCDSLTVTVSNPKDGAPAKAAVTYGTQSEQLTVAAGESKKVTFPASTTGKATVTFPELKLEIDVAYAKPDTCGGGGGLPVTGTAVGGLVAAGAVLLAAGAGMVVATRRRRVRSTF